VSARLANVTPTLALALIIQIVCLALLRLHLGRSWLTRPFSLLAIAAVVYHGVTELLLLDPGYLKWSTLRVGLPQKYGHDGALLVSVCLLVMTLVYLGVIKKGTAREPDSSEKIALDFLKWQPLGVLLATMLVANSTGNGYSSLTQFNQIGLLGQLTYQFLLVTAVLFSFALLRRFGIRWFIPVLALQLGLLATIGQRLELVTTSVMLLVLLLRAGMAPTRKQVAVSALLAIVGLVAITNSRAISGRGTFYSDASISTRVRVVATGLFVSPPGDSGPGLLADVANRLDGNAYVGTSLQQQLEFHDRPLGLRIVGASVLNTVPRVLLPLKDSFSLEDVSPLSGPALVYGAPPLNYLPGDIGLWLPDVGVAWLIAIMALAALFLGLLERWCFRGGSLLRVILIVTMVEGAMFFERGLPSYLVSLRGGLVYGFVLMALYRWWPQAKSRRQAKRHYRRDILSTAR
jgi:hypothetical protein